MRKEKNSAVVSALVWLCITMFYCYQYILRILPNIVMPEMIEKYGIGATEIGTYGSVYYMGYVAVHIPIGVLLSRFGGKLVLPLCVAVSAIGLLPLIYVSVWDVAVVGRILIGAGSSAAAIGALQVFRMLFPSNFGRMVGIMVSCGLITVVYGGKPVSDAIQTLGADAALNILLYSGLALAVLTYFVMPKSMEEDVSHSNMWQDIKAVLGNYKLLFTTFCAGLMLGPLEGFADVWSGLFLMKVYGLERSVADSITLSIYGGMCIGCVVLPFVAEQTRRPFAVVAFSAVAMSLAFVYILGGNATADSLYYTCLIVGVFCGYQIVVLAKVVTFVSEERSGIAGAVANMIIMSFGSMFHHVLGTVTEYNWTGEVAESGARIYTPEALVNGMYAIPIASVLAALGLFAMMFVNYTHAQSIKAKSEQQLAA